MASIAPAPLGNIEIDARVLDVLRRHPAEIIAALSAYQQQQAAAQEATRAAVLKSHLAALDITRLVANSPRRGAGDSKLTLVEFSDFQCPYCGKAHAGLQTFLSRHPEVSLVYKHLPLTDIHPQSLPAARAAWAAQQQGRFWEFHDALFSDQKQLGETRYVAIAHELGLDLKKFDSDRASAAADLAIKADLAQANDLEISGTPFFLINGIATSGALPAEGFEQLLAEARKDAVSNASPPTAKP